MKQRGGRENNKITRRHDLLALRRGRTSNRENLGEVQSLPTIGLQKEIPLVKSFWSTRGSKWWSGSGRLMVGNHRGSGWREGVEWMERRSGGHGGRSTVGGGGRRKDRVEPSPTNHVYIWPKFLV
jgi:hypothetical protein